MWHFGVRKIRLVSAVQATRGHIHEQPCKVQCVVLTICVRLQDKSLDFCSRLQNPAHNGLSAVWQGNKGHSFSFILCT